MLVMSFTSYHEQSLNITITITYQYMCTSKQICIYCFQNFEVQQGSILAQGYLIGQYLRGKREGLSSAVLTVVVDSIKQLGE